MIKRFMCRPLACASTIISVEDGCVTRWQNHFSVNCSARRCVCGANRSPSCLPDLAPLFSHHVCPRREHSATTFHIRYKQPACSIHPVLARSWHFPCSMRPAKAARCLSGWADVELDASIHFQFLVYGDFVQPCMYCTTVASHLGLYAPEIL